MQNNIVSEATMCSILEGVSVFVGGPIQFALERENSEARINLEISKKLHTLHNALKVSGTKLLSAHIDEDFGKKSLDFILEEITHRDYS